MTHPTCLTKWDERFNHTEPWRVDHLVYRPIPSSAESHLFPCQFVVDITSTLEQKLEAIRCYQSQFDGPRWERLKHYVLSMAGAEGMRAGYPYGELYALPRPMGVKDIMTSLTPWEIPAPIDPPQT